MERPRGTSMTGFDVTMIGMFIGVFLASSAYRSEEPSVAKTSEILESDVARLPHPGTVVPGAIAFSNDGRSVHYLKSENNSLSRVLWRAKVGKSPDPQVIARAPGSGDTDASVSRDEQLRRERQRLRDTGITQIAAASESDLMVMPIEGDLFVLDGSGDLRRLTKTASSELDPKPSPDGSRVAFVRNGDLHAIDVA